MEMQLEDRICITGGSGFVGKNLTRILKESGYLNVFSPSSKEVDLTSEESTLKYFSSIKPDYCFLLAGLVGGIKANSDHPIDFYRVNTLIAMNSFKAVENNSVKKSVYLGSSCIYPKYADQPYSEQSLLSGHLEPTNEMYALAKIGGVKLASYYKKMGRANIISAMPPNIYGPHDDFSPDKSHVIGAMINKFHAAKHLNLDSVELWGDGSPLREFIFVDDLCNGMVRLLESYDGLDHINMGSDIEVSILELAHTVSEIVGYRGSIRWNTAMPNGFPRKMMDNSKIKSLGINSSVSLKDGLHRTYQWYLESQS